MAYNSYRQVCRDRVSPASLLLLCHRKFSKFAPWGTVSKACVVTSLIDDDLNSHVHNEKKIQCIGFLWDIIFILNKCIIIIHCRAIHDICAVKSPNSDCTVIWLHVYSGILVCHDIVCDFLYHQLSMQEIWWAKTTTYARTKLMSVSVIIITNSYDFLE